MTILLLCLWVRVVIIADSFFSTSLVLFFTLYMQVMSEKKQRCLLLPPFLDLIPLKGLKTHALDHDILFLIPVDVVS